MRKSAVGILLCAVIAVAWRGRADDGTMHVYSQQELAGTPQDARWGNPYVWTGGVIACDGGIATLDTHAVSPVHAITNNVSDLTLGGIDFLSTVCTFYGEKITLVGDEPFLRKTPYSAFSSSVSDRCGLVLNVPLYGTGALQITGGGKFCLDHADSITGFSRIDVVDGVLAPRNVHGAGFTSLPVNLQGALSYQPIAATSADAAETTVAGAGVTCLPGAELIVNKCGAASAKMTVGPLTRGTRGSLLIRSSAGAGALGTSEKVLTTGTVPTYGCGAVAGWIAGRDAVEADYPVRLLAYDQEDGFVPFTAWKTDFSASTRDDAVLVSSSVTVTGEAFAAAVQVMDAADLVVEDGATLHLGDGVNPGVLILNRIGTAEKILAGGGTIDFGDVDGFVWIGSQRGGYAAAADVLRLRTKITGRNVTFISGGCLDSGSAAATDTVVKPARPALYIEPEAVGWTGETRFAGVELRFYQNSFPSGGDVYFFGSNNAVGSLWTYTFDYKEVTNPVYARGEFYHVPPEKAGAGVVFNALQLMGDTTFRINQQAPYVTFAAPVTGTGNLFLTCGEKERTANEGVKTYYFKAANTFVGKTVVAGNYPVYVATGATHGSGALEVTSEATVTFEGGPQSFTEAIDCKGRLVLSNGDFILSGSARIDDLDLRYATLQVGDDVSVDALSTIGSSVCAAGGGGRLTLGEQDGSSVISGPVTDGEGCFSLVKKGRGTLVLAGYAEGARTWTGETRVEGGAVRPRVNPLEDESSISYWLDASAADALVYDDDGRIVRWVSKAGDAVFQAGQKETSKATETILVNGHTALYLPANSKAEAGVSAAGHLKCYLYDKEVKHRTVFIVAVPENVANMGGIFGEYGKDYTERVYRESYGYGWRASSSAATFITAGGLRVNGTIYNERTDGWYHAPIVDGRTDVLTMVRADDAHSVFKPIIGAVGNNGFSGAICEVIAFNRVLSDREIRIVENYLGEKWKGAAFHADLPDAGFGTLSPLSDLSVANNAEIDLGGTDQTVAAFSGVGTVVNTGDASATLAVTGTCAFTGAFGAGVDFMAGAGAVISPPSHLPTTNGLAYWLDAARTESVLMNGTSVTGWVSRAGSVDMFVSDGVSAVTFNASDTAVHGLPTVNFGAGDCRMVGTRASKVRTLFYVHVDLAWANGGNPYIWGANTLKEGNPVGFYFSSANSTTPKLHAAATAFSSFDSFTFHGDVLRLDGADVPSGNFDDHKNDLFAVPANGTPYLLSFALCEANPHFDWEFVSAIGLCGGKVSGRAQAVAEVLAYDRVLSSDEIRMVEAYLTKKWLEGAGVPSDVTTSFTAPATLGVTGATPKPIVVEGDLSLDGLTFVAPDLDDTDDGACCYDLLYVNGAATGAFAVFNVPKPWRCTRNGNRWSACRSGLVLLFK